MRTRLAISTLIAAGFACGAAQGSLAQGAQQAARQCYSNSSGQLEVNVGLQFGYTDRAIREAIDTAKARGCQVYFQPGTYSYDAPVVNDGLRFIGQCADGVAGPSLLVATDAAGSAIFLRGSGSELICLKIQSPNASVRSGSNNANGVTIDFATNFLVDHVTVDKTAAAGIFNRGGSYGRITSNQVSNTLADGIHNTRGANHTDVTHNTVTNTGDDFIAVVSYVWQGVRSHDINIENNTVNTQPHGRGIVVSGGRSIRIVGNMIRGCWGSCIHIASEPQDSWNTYEVDDVEIADNVVRSPDQGNTHDANVFLWCANAARHISNVFGAGNDFDRSRQMIRVVATEGCAVSGITVSGFYGE